MDPHSFIFIKIHRRIPAIFFLLFLGLHYFREEKNLLPHTAKAQLGVASRKILSIEPVSGKKYLAIDIHLQDIVSTRGSTQGSLLTSQVC